MPVYRPSFTESERRMRDESGRECVGGTMGFLWDRVRRVCELRHGLAQMTLRDLRSQYAGSALGLVWSFVHPLVMALVLWYVFSFGLRAQQVRDYPFVV